MDSTRSDGSNRYDAIVIGAGMSGLAAGIRLAQFDKRVVVLERHYLWGGLNSFYKRKGRLFDVGLHALTNYVPARTRNAPLTRVLRQLRIRHEELELAPHLRSRIQLEDLSLVFTNEFERFEQEVAEAFPAERDGFARLARDMREAELGAVPGPDRSARAVLAEYLGDPGLIDALMLPVCYYGSAREDDVDWDQFVILFRSILLEGLSRPEGGIRPFLDRLTKRYKALGGELRMKCGVRRILRRTTPGGSEEGEVIGVELEDGTQLEAPRVLTSAGWVETQGLLGRELPVRQAGAFSFVETISVVDREPRELGCEDAVIFYCHERPFRYACPEGLVDVRSGVASAPNNFASREPLDDGCMRVTLLANPARWFELDPEQYAAAKQQCSELALDAFARCGADPRPHELDRDVFTPCTVKRFTSHVNGAVYGAPEKRRRGLTDIEGLILIGTDQGFLGVVGAMQSGISMANLHVLAGDRVESAV